MHMTAAKELALKSTEILASAAAKFHLLHNTFNAPKTCRLDEANFLLSPSTSYENSTTTTKKASTNLELTEETCESWKII